LSHSPEIKNSYKHSDTKIVLEKAKLATSLQKNKRVVAEFQVSPTHEFKKKN
jgi:hypothetical protein